MKSCKSTYRPESREDKSNRYRQTRHDDLLLKANIKKFNGNYTLETLQDGRIAIKTAKRK
jgi:hypothetical protein